MIDTAASWPFEGQMPMDQALVNHDDHLSRDCNIVTFCSSFSSSTSTANYFPHLWQNIAIHLVPVCVVTLSRPSLTWCDLCCISIFPVLVFFDLVISRKMYSHRYLMFVWACGTLIFNWLPVRFRVTISGYLTHIRRCHEYNFTYSIGKLCFPSESISVYWKYRAKSPPLPFFFGAKVQEKQNRKLGKLYSTVSLEM